MSKAPASSPDWGHTPSVIYRNEKRLPNFFSEAAYIFSFSTDVFCQNMLTIFPSVLYRYIR